MVTFVRHVILTAYPEDPVPMGCVSWPGVQVLSVLGGHAWFAPSQSRLPSLSTFTRSLPVPQNPAGHKRNVSQSEHLLSRGADWEAGLPALKPLYLNRLNPSPLGCFSP